MTYFELICSWRLWKPSLGISLCANHSFHIPRVLLSHTEQKPGGSSTLALGPLPTTTIAEVPGERALCPSASQQTRRQRERNETADTFVCSPYLALLQTG